MTNVVNSYDAFAHQVQSLLKKTPAILKGAGLSKKDANKFLEYILKFPVEHEELDKKLTKPEHEKVKAHIIEIVTAKNNMVIAFLHENGKELHEQAKNNPKPNDASYKEE